jgi:hypothetical protein
MYEVSTNTNMIHKTTNCRFCYHGILSKAEPR